MASLKPSASWQEMRRLLASKSKNELLNLIRDLYALTTDNKDFVHAQVLTPQPKAPKARQPKKQPSSASKAVPKIRQLATIARELHEGDSLRIPMILATQSGAKLPLIPVEGWRIGVPKPLFSPRAAAASPPPPARRPRAARP